MITFIYLFYSIIIIIIIIIVNINNISFTQGTLPIQQDYLLIY